MGAETDTYRAAEFLGCEVKGWPMDTLAKYVAKHPARPDAALLALVFSGFEKAMPKDCWRDRSASRQFYLNALADWGYTLSAVERLITDPAEDTGDDTEDADPDEEA